VAQEIAAGISGSRLVVVPDCGHLSTMERPEAVNRALTEWLAERVVV
jgi:pimeloyl-ACP methyl ester carboxylesterase